MCETTFRMASAKERSAFAEPEPTLERAERARCVDELIAARAHTDSLFALILPEAIYERAVAERHRFIFYRGHLEAFDWNLFREPLSPEQNLDGLDRLFAFGIDPDPTCAEKLPCDTPADWPTLATIERYCAERRQLVLERAASVPIQLLYVAIEHRLMHAETLCYLMHWLRLDQKHLLAPPSIDLTPAPQNQLVEIPAGTATLGRIQGFGWDNEYLQCEAFVPAFRIDRYKISNGQYLQFVRDGGPLPLFWTPRPDGQGFLLRCMFGEIPLPLAWPVYVTFEQAQAFATYRSLALPSEAQFHRAAFGTPQAEERSYPWGEDAPTALHGRFAAHAWDPQPVDATPLGDSAFGVAQLVGNGWEWTRTPFAPLPGFQPFPFYRGYSADFFDDQHRVIKGGSARTALRLLRRSFRNFYRTNYRYVYAGFRCVDDV